MKSILLKSPEFYLLLIILLGAYTPPFECNPLVVVALVPLLQIITKNKISGLIIGASFLVLNLFFLGAIISEFVEFSEFSAQAQNLILAGTGIFLLNLIMGTLMVYKYGPNRKTGTQIIKS